MDTSKGSRALEAQGYSYHCKFGIIWRIGESIFGKFVKVES